VEREEERNEWTGECRCSFLEDWQYGSKKTYLWLGGILVATKEA
jgi:hypothetical protein